MQNNSSYTHLQQEFIFVGGLHKSGTTLIHDIIAEATEVSPLCDRGIPCKEGQYLQSELAPDIYYGELLFGLSPQARLTEEECPCSEEIGERIYRELLPYWRESNKYLLEKTPMNLVRTRFLQALYPRARFMGVALFSGSYAASLRYCQYVLHRRLCCIAANVIID